MSEKTTKQSFLNFIFKETIYLVTPGQVNGKEGDTLDIPPEDEVIRKVKEDGTRGRENTLSL